MANHVQLNAKTHPALCFHCARNITTGSIRTARNTAGDAARKAAASNTAAGVVIIETSVAFTPYSRVVTNRTEAIPNPKPTPAPSSTIKNTRPVTRRAIFPAAAPSAIRIPISFSRCTTE